MKYSLCCVTAWSPDNAPDRQGGVFLRGAAGIYRSTDVVSSLIYSLDPKSYLSDYVNSILNRRHCFDQGAGRTFMPNKPLRLAMSL